MAEKASAAPHRCQVQEDEPAQYGLIVHLPSGTFCALGPGPRNSFAWLLSGYLSPKSSTWQAAYFWVSVSIVGQARNCDTSKQLESFERCRLYKKLVLFSAWHPSGTPISSKKLRRNQMLLHSALIEPLALPSSESALYAPRSGRGIPGCLRRTCLKNPKLGNKDSPGNECIFRGIIFWMCGFVMKG